MIPLPRWFGQSYPSVEDLEIYAWDMDPVVQRGPISGALIAYPVDPEDSVVIGLPSGLGILDESWVLAHELGHLALHRGYVSPWTMSRQETQAERWAACALIPESRIAAHANASLDAMIAALSAHYEDIPLRPCPSRRLAAKIGRARLKALPQIVSEEVS